jgi:hypothetical protein
MKRIEAVRKLASGGLVLLLASSGIVAQETPAEKLAVRYQKLFAATSGIMVQVKQTCKTEECQKITEEGLALIVDAQDKYKKGELVGEEREQFHKHLESVLMRSINALKAKSAKASSISVPSCPADRLKNVQTTDCEFCDEVFHELVEICALYLVVNPDAALICFAAATLGYARCLHNSCSANENTN